MLWPIQTQLLFFAGRQHPKLHTGTKMEAWEECGKMKSVDILTHYYYFSQNSVNRSKPAENNINIKTVPWAEKQYIQSYSPTYKSDVNYLREIPNLASKAFDL